MGRAERRRQERKANKKPAVYNLTQAQLDKMVRGRIAEDIKRVKQEATEDAVNTAMLLLLTLPLEVLITKYWEKSARKRCPKFTEDLLDLYTKWQNGEVDMGALKADLWEYGGVRLEERDAE